MVLGKTCFYSFIWFIYSNGSMQYVNITHQNVYMNYMPIENWREYSLSDVIYKSLMHLSDLNLKFIEQFVCRFKLNIEHLEDK